jgi:uncharacterized membrane protein
MVLLLVQGIGGAGGGAALIADVMGMPTEYLAGSPFDSYLVPGLILLLVLGIFPLAVVVGMWRADRWAWYGSFAVGCGLLIWLLVKITIIPFDVLQVAFGVVGLAIVVLTLLPAVRRYCGLGVRGA